MFKSTLKNSFFIESYIYSFIEELINKKLYYPEEKRSYDFKEFAKYLKDYVALVRDKQETFHFGRYRDYLDFRKKGERFEESLRKNKEIVYSKRYFLEYVHHEFVEGNKVAVKKYKKYQETKRQEEEERVRTFKFESESLKQVLLEEEKEHFYEILYFNYLNHLQENNLPPNKETYVDFRAQVFANFDERYLQEEEANYKKAILEQFTQDNPN
jgi:hypothetical protein